MHFRLPRLPRRATRRVLLGALLFGFGVLGAACASAETPEVTNGDPVLEEGRDLYIRLCQSCHGAAGGGSRGPKLADGEVIAKYPDIADNIAVVTDGRGAMPAFSGRLNAAEIEAIVRFTREVLSES